MKTMNEILSFPVIFFLTLFMISCSNDEIKNKIEIEFPTSSFSINPNTDTTIFGLKGTRLFIGSETFQFSDGSNVTDTVTLTLKEFYEMSDIVLADLSTVSDGKFLETAGMINLKASSEGDAIDIKEGKEIIVHFPKSKYDYRNMDLFYGDPISTTDSSVNNWQVDTFDLFKTSLKLGSWGWRYPAYDDSTSYNFIPKDFIDTGYYWNPLDFYIESYEFSASTIEEIKVTMNYNSKDNFQSWNDFGVECEMQIDKNGFIKNPKLNTNISQSTKKEILQFLKDLPQLEPGTNKYGDIIERKGYVFIQEGSLVPLFKTEKGYLQSFNSKYAQYENRPIENIDDAELEYFIFSISNLGWINCDIFIETSVKVDLLVNTPFEENTTLKLVFSDFNGILKADIVDNAYVFKNVPAYYSATLIGIKQEEGQFLSAFQEIIINDVNTESLDFEEITLSDFRSKMKAL